MNLSRLAALGFGLVSIMGTTGCYKATFYSNPDVVRGVQHDEWTSFFLFGLVGHEKQNIREFCPSSEAAEIRTGGNVGTSLVGVLTIGIYTPRKIYVTCATNGKAAPTATSLLLESDEAGQPRRIVRRQGDRMSYGVLSPVANQHDVWRVRFAESTEEVTP